MKPQPENWGFFLEGKDHGGGKRRGILKVSGRTEDGRLVVTGVFKLVSTYGIPLDIVLKKFEHCELVIDWLDFYSCSLKEGWKPITTLNKIKCGVFDVYGKDYDEIVINQLKTVLAKFLGS